MGPQFPLMLKEGMEFNVLKVFFSLKFYKGETEVGILSS